MRLLLDTHALLWALCAPERLGAAAREAIADPDNTVFASPVNVWEIEIKRAAGRLQAPPDLLADIAAVGFTPLPFTLAHAAVAGRLPPHHGDPFDRLLIGQAIHEALTLVSQDRHFSAYPVALLPADR